jgi:DNA-binding transcriptional MerR regulator
VDSGELVGVAEVDDRTGYRRYALRQLPRARTLTALRDVGMPLEDAAAIVDATDRSARRARLFAHRRRLLQAARQAAGRVGEFVVRGSIHHGRDEDIAVVQLPGGARNIAGHRLPGGLRRNERLEAPILTPTTKFEAQDRNLGRGDGAAPVLTDEVRIATATATRYILLAEQLTQRSFRAPELTAAERVARALRD